MYLGIILHILAKCAFIIGSYIMHYYLGKTMSAVDYGIVCTIITIINFEYLLLNNGVRQSVSNAISQQQYDYKNILKKGLVIQVILIIIIATVTIFFAETFGYLMGDANFVQYIKTTVIIIPFMGIYFLLLGVLNGAKLFILESSVLITYPILKLSVIPFVKYNILGDVILETEMGFLFAAIIIMIICFAVILLMIKSCPVFNNKISWKSFIKSSLSFSIMFITSSVIMNVDLLIVKFFSKNSAYVGYYAGATNFAKIPYYLLNAFFVVILPIITNLYIQMKYEKVKNIINDILELILSLVMPIVILITSTADSLLNTFYASDYETGTDALRYLTWGTFFLGILLVLNMIISATGRKNFTIKLSLFLLNFDIVICLILTKFFSITGAAIANFMCSGIGMIISLYYVVKIIGKIEFQKNIKIIFLNIIFMVVVFVINTLLNIDKLMFLCLFYVLSYTLFIVLEILLNLIDISNIKKHLIS